MPGGSFKVSQALLIYLRSLLAALPLMLERSLYVMVSVPGALFLLLSSILPTRAPPWGRVCLARRFPVPHTLWVLGELLFHSAGISLSALKSLLSLPSYVLSTLVRFRLVAVLLCAGSIIPQSNMPL